MNLWPTNPKDRKSATLVMIVVALLIAGFATRCRAADDPYIQFGAGSTIMRGETTALDLSVVYPDAAPGDADYAVGITFVGQSSLYGESQRPNFMWRAEIIDGFGRFDVGLGVVYIQNSDIYNSCGANFTLSLAYRLVKLPLTMVVRHFSNGGTCSPNKGRDMVFLAYRFKP